MKENSTELISSSVVALWALISLAGRAMHEDGAVGEGVFFFFGGGGRVVVRLVIFSARALTMNGAHCVSWSLSRPCAVTGTLL